ncbi:hypothetical protein [Anaerotignum sp.]
MNKEKNVNGLKNNVYSGFYSIVSFFASLVYLIADYVFDDSISAKIALAILIITIILVEVLQRKIRKGIDNNDERMMKWNEKIIKWAQRIGYWCYPLLTLSLIIAIIK